MAAEAENIKQKIVDTVKKEYRFQMVNMFEGNVSARLGDRVFITPSQVDKEIMTAEMIIETDLSGKIIYQPEGLKPSSELKMHLEVYRIRPDVRAVVHNHSTYATAFAVNGMPLVSEALTEMNLTFGEIPVVPYGTPGTEKIYKDFDKYLGNRRAVLLANHGVLAFGADLPTAYSNAEAVEKIAQTLFIARQMGQESKIPSEEIAALRGFGSQMRDAEIAKAK
jgi:Ribulose-5-phosphate 4-epimerase and related epimerases and aldolases